MAIKLRGSRVIKPPGQQGEAMNNRRTTSIQFGCDALPDQARDGEQDQDQDQDDLDGANMRGDFAFALSPHVDVALVRRGPDLVVGFGGRGRREPVAALAEETGWSFLGIDADRPQQLRSAPVTAFFRRGGRRHPA